MARSRPGFARSLPAPTGKRTREYTPFVKRLVAFALVLGLAALVYRSSAERLHASEQAASCTCAQERERGGWCSSCNLGWAAGRQVRSQILYEALDMHGHDIDGASLECASCRAALASDGYCEKCSRGFQGGRAYLSDLSWRMARGDEAAAADKARFLDEALVEVERCELCAAALVSDGDCPRCRLSFRDGVRRPLASSAR